MGQDKATLEIHGERLIDRVARAHQGFDELLVVGGQHAYGVPGARHVQDDHPGEGPLGALVSAFAASAADHLVLTACDLPNLSQRATTSVLEPVTRMGAQVSVLFASGEPQWHVSCWDRTALGALTDAFNSGVRSLRRSTSALRRAVVVIAEAEEARDVDTPEELHRARSLEYVPKSG